MLKNLKYLVAVGLLAFGYTNQANALFGICSADVGADGGPDAYTCIKKTSGAKDPKMLSAFIMHHCQGKIRDAADRQYCAMAKQKFADAQEIIDDKRSASNKRSSDSVAKSTAKAKASAKERNRKAQAGEDDGFLAGIKGKFSKKRPIAEVDEDEDTQDEDEDEDMRPAKKRKLSQFGKSKSSSTSSRARNMPQFDEDEEEEDEEEEDEEEEMPVRRQPTKIRGRRSN